MNLDLQDKVVAVTGGTGSLGTAIVRMLVNEGARCVVPLRDMSELDAFPFNDHEQVALVKGIDLADENQARYFFDELVERESTLWGSVNAAGGFGMGKLERTSLDDFEHQMRINVYTCYNSCRSAVKAMRETDGKGRIVNIASRPALEPRQGEGLSAYTSSKAAVAALTEALAAELVDEDILINAVAPSIIDTEPNRNAMPDADHDKWVKPEDIASHILYLLSPTNRVTRGAVVPVYGKS